MGVCWIGPKESEVQEDALANGKLFRTYNRANRYGDGMSETPDRPGFKDRKLGDEWADWDGHSKPHEQESDERSATFLVLAAVAVAVFICLSFAAWYMMRPRVEQFNALLPPVIEWSVGVFGLGLLIVATVEVFVYRRAGKSLFPYRVVEKLFLLVLPKALWLGQRLGISRDRVGNSFIKVHNYIMTTDVHRLNTDRLLMLLPRCLGKEARAEIMTRAEHYEMHVVTAGGGEEARKAIAKYRPTLILAVACERDLLSGIKDVSDKVPVLAIPNRRPEGPCKNTCLQIEKFDDILKFIRAPKKSEGATSDV